LSRHVVGPLLAVLAGGCAPSAPANVAVASVPVLVALAEARDVPVEVRAVGTVEPLATAAIRPQVGGLITAVTFVEGGDVRAGDTLFTIEPKPFEVALSQAEAILARDQAQARNAAADARRAEDLFAQGILAKEQYEQVHSNAQSLAASVRADEGAVEIARVQLAYCKIRSPIDGRTGSALVKAGNVVKAVDSGPLVVVNQISPIAVNFTVPEARLAEIKGAAAARRLVVSALIAGDESRPETGELQFVDNAVDRSTGSVHLRGTFVNPGRRLWPGQFVSTSLIIGVRKGAVVVPATALQDGQSGRFVYVVTADKTAEVRQVQVGDTSDGRVVVLSGLRAGETVVIDGQLRIVPGAKVEIRPGAASS